MKEQFQTIHGNVIETPDWLYKRLDSEFDFQVDLACNRMNKKADVGLCFEDTDSLAVDWHTLTDGWMWLNPPYSPLKPWVEKCQREFLKGAKIVVLMPPILSTRYFSKVPPAQIRLMLGRVSFLKDGVEMKGNTTDSCIVVYGPPVKADVVYVTRDEYMGHNTAGEAALPARKDA